MLYSYSMTSGTTTAKAESYVRAFMAYIRGGGGVSNNGLAGSVLISTGPSITFEGQCLCDTTSGCGACNTAVSYIQKTVLASPTCGSGSAWLQTCSTATQVRDAHISLFAQYWTEYWTSITHGTASDFRRQVCPSLRAVGSS